MARPRFEDRNTVNSRVVGVRITEPMYEQLAQIAAAMGRSPSEIIRWLIQQVIDADTARKADNG